MSERRGHNQIHVLIVTGGSSVLAGQLPGLLDACDLPWRCCNSLYEAVGRIVTQPAETGLVVVGSLTELAREDFRFFRMLQEADGLACCCLVARLSGEVARSLPVAMEAGVTVAGSVRELAKAVRTQAESLAHRLATEAARPVSEPPQRIVSTRPTDLLTQAEIEALFGETSDEQPQHAG